VRFAGVFLLADFLTDFLADFFAGFLPLDFFFADALKTRLFFFFAMNNLCRPGAALP
jgi:hypothetical protein